MKSTMVYSSTLNRGEKDVKRPENGLIASPDQEVFCGLGMNPARSTGVAVFVGGWAIAQLWLFWVVPIVGGLLGAVIYRFSLAWAPEKGSTHRDS